MTSTSTSSGSSTAEVRQLKAYNEDLSVCFSGSVPVLLPG